MKSLEHGRAAVAAAAAADAGDSTSGTAVMVYTHGFLLIDVPFLILFFFYPTASTAPCLTTYDAAA